MNKKILIALGVVILLLFYFSDTLPYLTEDHPTYNEYADIYLERDSDDGYRLLRSGVYFHQVCGAKLRKCKEKLDGVDAEDFTPVGRSLATVTEEDGTKVYYKSIDITSVIASPENFRALEPLSLKPRYFTDGEYIYEDRSGFSGELWKDADASMFDDEYAYRAYTSASYSNSQDVSDFFPIKISADDTYSVPEEFQTSMHPAFIHHKILFVNDDVYLDGRLIYGASADTFSEITFADTPKPNIGPWFKDASHVYYEGFLVANADPNTFKLLRAEGSTRGDSHLAADKNYVYFDYGILGQCHHTDRSCEVDLRIPGVSPVGVTVPSSTEASFNDFHAKHTIENNQGTFYLDGQPATDAPVEVIIKRYDTYRTQFSELETSFSLKTYVNNEFCRLGRMQGGRIGDLPEQSFTIYVNDEEANQINRCYKNTRVLLLDGPNVIKIKDNSGATVLTRTYVNTGNISE